MQDEGFDRCDPVQEERRDVAVAPEFAEQGLCVPQHEVRFVRPREAGVAREQRSPFVPFAGALGRSASHLRRSRHLRRPDRIPEHPPESGVRGGEARLEHGNRWCRFPRPGIAAWTSDGAKLKKVAMTVSAVTAPIGADREAK